MSHTPKPPGERPSPEPFRPKPTELFQAVPVPKPVKHSAAAAERLAEKIRKERKVPRVTVKSTDARLLYRFVKRSDSSRLGPTYEGTLVDVSSAGMRFRGFLPENVSPEALIAGDVLVGLNIFFLSVDAPFKALGRLAWCNTEPHQAGECEMGVEFVTKADDSDDILNAYLIHSGTRRFR